jgi:hypothetical protein
MRVQIPGELIPIVLFIMIPVTAIGVPIARAIARRIDRSSLQPPVSHEMGARLDRMEQAIDAIAVEVERIAEGQRFTTRLLSERAGEPRGERLPGGGTPDQSRGPANA